MANENSARDRSNDPLSRGPAKAAPASDPLAELARLIGRSELLSQPAREARALAQSDTSSLGSLRSDAPPPVSPQAEQEPAPLDPTGASSHEFRPDHAIPESHQDWPGSPPPTSDLQSEFAAAAPPPPYSPAPAQNYDDPGYASPPLPGSSYPDSAYPGSSGPIGSFSDPGLSDFASPAQPAPSSSYPGTEFPEFPSTNFPNSDFPSPSYPNASSGSFPSPGFATPGFSDFPNTELPRSNFQAANYSGAPRSSFPLRPDTRGNDSADLPAFIPPGYDAAPDRHDHEPLFPSDPEASGMPPPHDDDFYDDEPRGRRRGLLIVVAVLGLAVIGTAGAFGYRTMFSGARTASAPPVIRASNEPNKVAPPPSAPDPSASKFSYDRFGDAGKDEKVLKREEKPVDLAKVTPPPPPPPAPAPANTTTVTPSTNPPSAIGEPRRVRTVPIRPDQGGDASTAAPAQQPSTVSPRQANAYAPTSRSNARVATRTPAPTANAPLSLSPDANNAPPPQEAPAAAPIPQARSLPPAAPAPPPRATPPAPARVASAPAQAPAQTSTIGGGYLVQVTSQRSQADAESAYRGIQSKYPSVLANQPHQVRRADLGAKGTYYRAMVGPFGTREAAVQLCVNLKQAGGDCVVQH